MDYYEFVVDAMLGKLAKLLRIMGYSTYYSADAEDGELMRIAGSCGAILITCDRRLYERALERGLRAVLLPPVRVASALKILSSAVDIELKIHFDKTRCPLCNGRLNEVPRERVRGMVPEPVYRAHRTFFICPLCGKVYWIGSHIRSIENMLTAIRNERVEAKHR